MNKPIKASDTYESYKESYTALELSTFKVRRSNESNHPACPLCGTSTYVFEYHVGLTQAVLVEELDGTEDIIEAPMSCIYDGYDWDCRLCLIIF